MTTASDSGAVAAASASSGWLRDLARVGASGEPAVLVSVAAASGSTPRPAGTRMLVTADALHGTIGGGHLEWKAMAEARRLLAETAALGLAAVADPAETHRPEASLVDYALGPSLGQCCGGAVSLVFEVLKPGLPAWLQQLPQHSGPALWHATWLGGAGPRLLQGALSSAATVAWTTAEALQGWHGVNGEALGSGRVLLQRLDLPTWQIVLFGAGHVGRALMQVLAGLPCQVRWIDSRAQAFDGLAGLAGNVQCIPCEHEAELIDEAAQLPAGSDVLVMTHSHALDQRLCEVLLRRGEFSYLGLIGSATKRSLFERRLSERGIGAAQLARLTCPIGIAGISGKEPGVIAVAIAAQLLQRRQQG